MCASRVWERLRGKVVLIETDNMAAKGAAANMASKSAEMQELVRRWVARIRHPTPQVVP